jgi:hypothetical protein
MKKLSINFINTWKDFDKYDNLFTWVLNDKYDLSFDDNPDILITFDAMLNGYKNSKKILFSCEASTNIGNCDYGLMQYDMPDITNSERLPLYLYYIYHFIKKGVIKDFSYFFNNREFIKKDKFCVFVCGGTKNGSTEYRDFFYKKLSNYKKIDCPGNRYNNMPKLLGDSSLPFYASDNKRNFIKNYKFTFALERTMKPVYLSPNNKTDNYIGYTTEKIIEPMVSGSLPIYYGNVDINNEFNSETFIHINQFENDEYAIEKIIEIDNNDKMYKSYMTQPLTYKNKYFDKEYLLSILEKIIEA